MSEPITLIGLSPDEARVMIRDALAADPNATRTVYAALAQMTWALLVESRPEGDLRNWHALILAARTRIRTNDPDAGQRLIALSDLLRESISSWATFGRIKVPSSHPPKTRDRK